MSRLVVLLGLIAATTIGTATVAAQTTSAGDDRPFAFEVEQTAGHRGLAVQGYVYNPLPWRITNVRLQVDSFDANGTLIASASGWVQGDVSARGRGYFYVPMAAPAPTYRARVEAFDKVMLEAP